MNIVRITGGLGNQLFQYAFGKSLSQKTDAEVVYDTTWFQSGADYAHDILYLNHFETQYKIASKSDIDAMFPMGRIGKYLAKRHYSKSPRVVQKLFDYYREIDTDTKGIFTTPPYSKIHSTGVYHVGEDAYFDGYWQAEQYVESVSEILRDELTLREAPTGRDAEIHSKINSCESVSIHFRRGDYAKGNNILPKEYHQNAIEVIESQVENAEFFVFSDDIEWVKNEFNIDSHVTYVDHNDAETCYEDLRLMAECNHNIIANSTFSWWGGWLNRNSSKIVVAPDRWIGKPVDEIDILPTDWQTVSYTDVLGVV